MAGKDYAGRKPKPKPRKKQNTKRQPEKKKKPIMAIILFIGLAVGLGYVLDKVSGSADSTAPAEQKQAPIVKLKPKDKDPLPEKPKEVWQYPQDLQEKEVFVEIPEQKKSTVRYQMQCGSFRQKEQAESMKATIAFQGFTANIKQTGKWYRVVLGPYERKRQAEKDRHQIKRAGITTCEIWHWKP